MVVRKRKTILERLRKRIFRIGGHGADAFADVAGRRHVRFLTQDARRSAIIGHGHNGRRFHAHGQQRANGNRRTRAATDNDSTQVRCLRNNRIRSVERGKRFGHRRVVRKRPIIQVCVRYLHIGPLARPLGADDGAVGTFGQLQIAMRHAYAIPLLLEIIARRLG